LPYTIKISPRAKYARLKMTPYGGLVVVVPKGFDKKKISSLLLHHEEWIKKMAAKFDALRQDSVSVRDKGLPSQIVFPDFSETWSVVYNHAGSGGLELVESNGNSLFVSGDAADMVLCRRLLCSWLKHRARAILIPSLEKLAAAHGFNFAVAGVRLQHSRWGSCSSRRSITLNTKLLFLPDYLVRYIMVHELCHTVHLNHSRAFWSLVHQHDPLCYRNDLEMKTAWKYVPEWVCNQA